MHNQDSFSNSANDGVSLNKTSAPAMPAANTPLSDFPAPNTPLRDFPAPDAIAPIAPAPIAQPFAVAASGAAMPNAASDAATASESVPLPSQAGELISARNSGANWFFWIVGLSIINTLISLTGTDWGFSLGVAATQIADYFAFEGQSTMGRIFALGFDVLVFGFYALCGVQAMRGATWAFVLGLIFFALDTLLMLLMQQWIGLLLHGWAIFSIFTGLIANTNLRKLQLAPPSAAPNPWSN